MLEIENLSVDLNARPVLDKLAFTAEAGEVLAVIGPNGAGKTTLLRALCGLIPIRTGQVKLDGEDLAGKNSSERAKIMAAVPQASNLPPAFSVWDAVLLGRTPHLNWLGQTSAADDEIARDALSQTNSLELRDRKIAELSAGEQQRVLLARALAQTTPVLLMDEPTTHLDLKYQVELLELTRRLTRQKKLICVMVLHDLNLAGMVSDQVLVLDHGRMAGWGKPGKVLNSRLLSRVYQLPVQVEKSGRNLHFFPRKSII
jgi:ABC-type cobalamin/Fe3+-siderophores transport system ATPase subunit